MKRNLVPRAFPLKNVLREKPWGRGWMKRSRTYFYRDTKGGLYTTRNDPRPQMIPKIALNTTQNDPRPQFFHTRPEMIPEELSEWNGMKFNSRRC